MSRGCTIAPGLHVPLDCFLLWFEGEKGRVEENVWIVDWGGFGIQFMA